MRGCFDTISALTIIDGIEIHLEYLVFAEHLLKFERDIGFAHFSLDRGFVRFIGKHRIAYELLRDGRSAFPASARKVHHDCAGDTQHIHTIMFIEALVFRCNRAFEHVNAHFRKLDRIAILDIEFSEQRSAVVGINAGLLRVVESRRIFIIGQILQPNRCRCSHRNAAGTKNDQHDNKSEHCLA